MPVRFLRQAPITLPSAVVVALLAWWSADQGGYAISLWAPGLVVVLVLLGVALTLVPNAWGAIPRTIQVATGAMAGYTLWSLASLAWAADRGAAWEGSLRTLLYLAIFVLFALWRQRAGTALALTCGWVLAVEAVVLIQLVRMGAQGNPRSFFADDRLIAPAGYPNATAALALMAFWPAVILASGRRVPWLLRATLAGGAVALADIALMALSRGAVVAFPITALVLLAVLPGRLRLIGFLALVGAGVAASAPVVLDVQHALTRAGNPTDAVTKAVQFTLAAALVVGLLTGVIGAWETARPPGEATVRRVRTAGRVIVGVGVVAILAGAVVVGGNPVDRAHSAWDSFKGGYGDGAGGGNRLVSGLGSNRYDFYRVGVDAFTAHPLAGLGADNFQQTYLVHGRSDETPRYPHSVILRTLAETGIVGAALLFGALIAAFAAAWRALRAPDELVGTVAAAAISVPVYWLIHGSADWFFEYAGLGAAAFAFLGLACALSPRPQSPRAAAWRMSRPVSMVAVLALLGLAAIAPLTLWMADSEVTTAGSIFAARPAEALDRLDRASSLNPFSAQPASVAGSIALRFNDLHRADGEFVKALDRVEDDQYATLERGAIASALGRPADALRLLQRAVALAPRDPLAKEALAIVSRGETIDIQNLNRAILIKATQLSG